MSTPELRTTDGQPIDLGKAEELANAKQEFAQAMAEPPKSATTELPRKSAEAKKPAAKTRARTTTKAKTDEPAKPLEARDYTESLGQLATGVWVSSSAIPVTKPYAYLWKQTAPGMVQAWNVAANQNAAVRSKVDKLASGEGGIWVLGVAMATVPFVAGCWEIFKASPADRQKIAAANDSDFEAWVRVNMPGVLPEQDDANATAS